MYYIEAIICPVADRVIIAYPLNTTFLYALQFIDRRTGGRPPNIWTVFKKASTDHSQK